MRSCWRTRRWPFFGHLAFEANWKGEKLDKWVPHELTKNQKHRHSEVSSFILLNNNEPFLYQIVLCNEKWIVYDNQWWPAQWLDSKAKLAPKKGHNHYLVVSELLQLSESQQNHYTREVCSENWWDAWKTATLAASIGQQKGPNSFPWQCTTAHRTTSASKVEQIELRSLTSSAMVTWPFAN